MFRKGCKFCFKSVLYSQDPGSGLLEGNIPHRKTSTMVKEFRDEAFSLEEGEISDLLKPILGGTFLWWIKYVGKRWMSTYFLHPRIDQINCKKQKEVRYLENRIIDEEITFRDAALHFLMKKKLSLTEEY